MAVDHRAEAERLLSSADTAMAAALEKTLPIDDQQHAAVLAGILTNRAAAHATLASREAAAADTASYRHTIHTLRFALIRQVAEGLALSETDEAHQHARGLAAYLDSVGLNVDQEVDDYIRDVCGDSYVRDARKAPSVRRAELDAMPPPF
ncbi:hypothetical protein [Streptomyces jumonjinensis]|uniref:hypothetical protein n=1 Tax=Streptomyces jumonjinensis TaxID=1945 RepID=UPI0037A117D1